MGKNIFSNYKNMYREEVLIVKMEDLRFNLTEEMNNMMIEMLIAQQMLKEVMNLSKMHREFLENHKLDVMEEFKKEFQKHNVEQIKKYNELMNK